MSGPDKCMLRVVSSYWLTCNMMYQTCLKLIQLHDSHCKQHEIHSLQSNLFLTVLFEKAAIPRYSTNFYGNRVQNIHSLLPALIIRIHSPAANQLSDPYGHTSLHTPMNPKHSVASHPKRILCALIRSFVTSISLVVK